MLFLVNSLTHARDDDDEFKNVIWARDKYVNDVISKMQIEYGITQFSKWLSETCMSKITYTLKSMNAEICM